MATENKIKPGFWTWKNKQVAFKKAILIQTDNGFDSYSLISGLTQESLNVIKQVATMNTENGLSIQRFKTLQDALKDITDNYDEEKADR